MKIPQFYPCIRSNASVKFSPSAVTVCRHLQLGPTRHIPNRTESIAKLQHPYAAALGSRRLWWSPSPWRRAALPLPWLQTPSATRLLLAPPSSSQAAEPGRHRRWWSSWRHTTVPLPWLQVPSATRSPSWSPSRSPSPPECFGNRRFSPVNIAASRRPLQKHSGIAAAHLGLRGAWRNCSPEAAPRSSLVGHVTLQPSPRPRLRTSSRWSCLSIWRPFSHLPTLLDRMYRAIT
jgi:hypothetical protein